MEKRKFSSLREEALEIARDTRKKIINNELDAVSTLRACLVIANILNKDEIQEWIERELFGYYDSDKLPDYRILSCQKKRGVIFLKGFHPIGLYNPVSFLLHCLKINECRFSER